MSSRYRDRSPHPERPVTPTKRARGSTGQNDLSLSPASSRKQALWRQRRQAAESEDYNQRKLSPSRLSPYRAISPYRSNTPSGPNEPISWAEEEEVDEADIYLDRAERALSGLEKYQKEFKQYTPEVVEASGSANPMTSPGDKENRSPNTGKKGSRKNSGGKGNSKYNNNSFNSNNKQKPSRPVAIETDANVLIRRQKDIDYGKNQEVYAEYLRKVEKDDRSDLQPWTPDKYEKMTRRNWDKQVKIWRKQLHYWEDPKPVSELLTPGTSPCPSPHRRRSPVRFLNLENQPTSQPSKALFQNTIKLDDDCAMDGISAFDSSHNESANDSSMANISCPFLKVNTSSNNQSNIPSTSAAPSLGQSLLKTELMDEASNSQMSVDEVPAVFRN